MRRPQKERIGEERTEETQVIRRGRRRRRGALSCVGRERKLRLFYSKSCWGRGRWEESSENWTHPFGVNNTQQHSTTQHSTPHFLFFFLYIKKIKLSLKPCVFVILAKHCDDNLLLIQSCTDNTFAVLPISHSHTYSVFDHPLIFTLSNHVRFCSPSDLSFTGKFSI